MSRWTAGFRSAGADVRCLGSRRLAGPAALRRRRGAQRGHGHCCRGEKREFAHVWSPPRHQQLQERCPGGRSGKRCAHKELADSAHASGSARVHESATCAFKFGTGARGPDCTDRSGNVAQPFGQLDRDAPRIDHPCGRHVVHRRILAIRLRELDALRLRAPW